MEKFEELAAYKAFAFSEVGIAAAFFARAIGHRIEVSDIFEVIDEQLLLPCVRCAFDQGSQCIDDALIMIRRVPGVFVRAPENLRGQYITSSSQYCSVMLSVPLV